MDWSRFLPARLFMLDEKGQEIYGWQPTFERKGAKDALVTLRPVDDPLGAEERPPIPAKLLFYRMIRTTAEIPFEFRDIPLP